MFSNANAVGISPRRIGFLLVLAVLSSLLSLVPIRLLAELGNPTGEVSTFMAGHFPFWHSNQHLLSILAYCALCAVVSILIRNYFAAVASNVASGGVANLRAVSATASFRAPWHTVRQRGEDEVADTISHDSEGVHRVFSMPMYGLFSDVLDMVFVLVLTLSLNPYVVVLLIFSAPVLAWFAHWIGKRQFALMRESREATAGADAFLTSALRNLELVKIYAKHSGVLSVYGSRCEQARAAEVRANNELGVFFTVQGLAQTLLTFTAVYLVSTSAPTLGAAAASGLVIYQYCGRFFRPLSTIVGQMQSVSRGVVALKRVKSICDLPQEESALVTPSETVTNEVASSGQGLSLKLEAVTVLGERGEQIVQVQQMRVPAGGLAVIVGESGSGKSSLLRGLLGLLPARGVVTIGGLSFRLETPRTEAFCASFGLATQESWGAGITVREALLLGDEDELSPRLLALAKRLNIDVLVADAARPASSLSAGELRRLALLRVLGSPRSVTLLDEVDSNVDPATRNLMIEVISDELRGKSTIVWVTHNPDFMAATHPDVVLKVDCSR